MCDCPRHLVDSVYNVPLNTLQVISETTFPVNLLTVQNTSILKLNQSLGW